MIKLKKDLALNLEENLETSGGDISTTAVSTGIQDTQK